MRRLSTNDQADLVLLAILFFFLVLYCSAVAGDRQKAEQGSVFPQTIATAAEPADPGIVL